jgi:hypothetical protein
MIPLVGAGFGALAARTHKGAGKARWASWKIAESNNRWQKCRFHTGYRHDMAALEGRAFAWRTAHYVQ